MCVVEVLLRLDGRSVEVRWKFVGLEERGEFFGE